MSLYFGKYPIDHVQITGCDMSYILAQIDESIQKKKRLVIAPLASHAIMLAHKDTGYKRILNSFELNLPDSFYLYKALKHLYHLPLQNRLYGPAILDMTLEQAHVKKYSLLFIGKTTDLLSQKLQKRYKGLKTNFIDAEGYIFDQKGISELKNLIAKTKEDIIVIGIGTPVQHYIAASLVDVNKPILAVGAATLFITNPEMQASHWIGEHGLEWLYRLLSEPQRLWKRYLYLGPQFVVVIVKQYLAMRMKK